MANDFLLKTMVPSALLLMSLGSTQAMAIPTELSGKLHVDDQFEVYLSTADTLQGTLVGSGLGWQTLFGLSSGTILAAGQDYFLHVKAANHGGPAGFIGEFDLTGAGHVFANNSSTLLTNSIDWDVSTTGWNNYVGASFKGNNGDFPWGAYPAGIDASADWIWSSSVTSNSSVYFSTKISAVDVPEPSVVFLLGVGIAGLVVSRRKRA